jgi:hypothetical protein
VLLPSFAFFGEPYRAAEKTASELTLRYCCSTRLTSSCFATYARSADLTSARVYRALVLSLFIYFWGLEISEREGRKGKVGIKFTRVLGL